MSVWRGRRAKSGSGIHARSRKRRRERGLKVSPRVRIQCGTLIETPNAQAMVDAVEPWFAGGYAIL
jgi:hypothetical protein